MLIDRLEPRQLFATISGVIFNDADASKTFDATETAARGTTVFIDANANGTFDSGEVSTTTDRRGQYTFDGLAAGDYLIGTTLAAGDFKQTTATEDGTVQGRFNIEYRNIDPKANRTIKAALMTAAARWEEIIVGDVPDVRQRDGSVVDDIVLDVRIAYIDGPSGTLAAAGPTALRADYTPYRGEVYIDSGDAQNSQLVDILTHEIGHALGLGTSWIAKQLITGRNSKSPRFIGDNAVREYNAIYETNNLSIPIENTFSSGTRESHWKEDIFKEELMTGFIDSGDMPISRMTVGQFEDLGYEVNYDAADDWDPAESKTTKKLPTDFGGVAREQKLTVARDDVVTDLNFGIIEATRPVIRSFSINPSPAAVGNDIVLTAAAITDADGDTLSGVSFWRESNGIEGLQKDSDTLIGVKTAAKQRQYRIQTSTTGLLGDTQFYAVATDESGRSGRRTGVVNITSTTAPTASPTGLSVRQRNSSTVRFAFTNTNPDVAGYRIQIAAKNNFGRGSIVKEFNIDTNGTTIDGLVPGKTYYVRVRAYNLAGSTSYSSALAFETV